LGGNDCDVDIDAFGAEDAANEPKSGLKVVPARVYFGEFRFGRDVVDADGGGWMVCHEKSSSFES